MQCVIINLPRSVERQAFQARQMQSLGLTAEFLTAVDENSLGSAVYEDLRNRWERPMRKSEVSCFLSHRNAWSWVLASGRPALILEDDALLAHSVGAVLESLGHCTHLDLVTLETRGRKKIMGKTAQKLSSGHHLVPLYQDRTGAAAYVLWPSGAQKLLEKASQGHAGLADAFISSHYALSAWQIEPAQAIQLDMCAMYQIPAPIVTQSTISVGEKPLTQQRAARSFRCKRVRSQLRMAARALSVLGKATRREVAIDRQSFERLGA